MNTYVNKPKHFLGTHDLLGMRHLNTHVKAEVKTKWHIGAGMINVGVKGIL